MSAESVSKELVLKHLHLVKFVAHKIYSRMPGLVEVEDLIQWGHMGLMDAAKKYDTTRENKFSTYAEWRIRGAMLDGIRDQDLMPRSTRDLEKIIEKAKSDFHASFGRLPGANELAENLGIDVEKLRRIESRVQPLRNLSIDNFDLFTAEDRQALLISAQNKSADIVSKIDAMQKLNIIVSGLSPIDRMCFMLFYIWGLTMTEIADLAGVSESRISQRIAVAHLRGKNIRPRRP